MTNIGLEDKNSAQAVKILTRLLADEFVLYTKTRGYHWNVAGMQFNGFHKFFEAQYQTLEGIVDDVAERARTIGGPALVSLQEMLDNKTLEEDTNKNIRIAAPSIS
jgi:starvation-inducible DNA-binding protein